MTHLMAILSHITGRAVFDTSLILMSVFVFFYAHNIPECPPYGKFVMSISPEPNAASATNASEGVAFAEVESQQMRKPFTSHVFDPNDPEAMLKFEMMYPE